MLGAVTAERRSYEPPKSSVEYHARVKVAGDLMPLSFGDWNGEDHEVAADAKKMLRANVLINRTYQNKRTGLSVGYLLVQCPDARAIKDHYPPICYRTRGLDQDLAVAADWQSADMKVTGMEYIFSRFGSIESRSMVVDNFIIMPDGSFQRDMEAAKAASNDLHKRFFGAAQFQLVFDRRVTEQDRQDAMRTFIGESREVLQAIRSGLVQ